MEDLSDRFKVLAPDLLGAGRSPGWPENHAGALSDEVQFISPVLAQAGEEFSLVGHSYGGAVALKVALEQRERVKAIVLYEPTLFAVLEQASPDQSAFDEIESVVEDAVGFIERNDLYSAAERFIDYWIQDGAWETMSDRAKEPIANSIVDVHRWWHALGYEPTTLEELSRIEVPVLCMKGARSPASSTEVARLLTAVLPEVETIELADMGHMAPVTHPERVNPHIENFLTSHSL